MSVRCFSGCAVCVPGGRAARFGSGGSTDPLLLRFRLSIFGTKTRYPHYHGYFESGNGGGVVFYFAATQPVRWVTATSCGMTAGLDGNFDRLSAATGWKIVYQRF
jgi:hypothetical protein